jgi:hypothetical protein
MPISSRQFNQDSSGAKKAANDSPVFITERGKTSHVLMTIEHYEALKGNSPNVVDLLAMKENTDDDFEPPKSSDLIKPIDLS